MKFESGVEQKFRYEKKIKGEKNNFADDYADFNEEYLDDLLKKRSQDAAELARRQKERIEKLKKMKETGVLYVKKQGNSTGF